MPRPAMNGVRKHVIVTDKQEAGLQRYSKKTGLTESELIRRAIDFYLAHAADRLSKQPA